jgi:octopine/nopaline transport system permease protein/arginine/ornithine transport system permease protein
MENSEPFWGQRALEAWPEYLSGTLLTLELTAISVVIGLVFAMPVAFMRLSKKPYVWMPTYGYMFFFRGTPLIVQIYLVYYGSGQFVQELRGLGLWHFFREPYFCALLTLTLNTTAYTAEILRGAIQAVPYGEIEAAKAVGMSRWKQITRIILPKAWRIGLPAYSNEVVFLFQSTSLVSIITLMDLTGVARKLVSETYRTYEMLIMAGVIYLCISYLIFYVFKLVERRLMRHIQARPDAQLPAEPAAAAQRV